MQKPNSPNPSRLQQLSQGARNRWKTITLILLLAGGLVFYFVNKAQANKVELVTEQPQIRNLTKTLEISGFVDAKEKARLRFALGGKVVYLGAKEGDAVKKNQTIATIDQATLNKQLQQDLNLYMQERWNWEETRDSVKDKALDTSQNRAVDQEQWQLENTVLNVEIRDISIRNTYLSAPFTGILTSAPTAVAGVQLLGSDYFEVVNPDSLVFRAAVDESDITLVSEGQLGRLELDSLPEEEIETTINYIAYSSTETSSGTSFIVEFKLDQAMVSRPLRIGMNGDINIVLEEKNEVLSIPNIAVTQRDGQNYVNILNSDGEASETTVETGLETDDYVEITSGLSETDQVVIPQ